MQHKIGNNRLCIICLIILFMIQIVFLEQYNGTIFADELGYWGTAAFINNKNWSYVLSQISYYSYIYGLIFAIPMALGLSFDVLYKVSIIFNVICNLISFVFSCKVVHALYPKHTRNQNVIIAFLASLYSGTLALSQASWTESLLILIFWCSIYLLVKLIREPSYFRVIVFALCISFGFVVHLRYVTVLIVGGGMLLLLFCTKKIDARKLIVSYAIICLVIIAHTLFKDYIITNVFENNILVANNDFSSASSRIRQIFSVKGLENFVISFLGKVTYLMISTCMVGVIGLEIMLSQVIKTIKKWNLSKTIDDNTYVHTYVSASFIAMLLLCTIYILDASNRGYLFYGRYIEVLFGPLLIIGISFLCDEDIRIGRVITYCLIILFLSFLLQMPLSLVNPNDGGIWATGMAFFFTNANSQSTVIYLAVGTTIFIFLLIICLHRIGERIELKKIKHWKQIWLIVVLGGYWIFTAAYMIVTWILPQHEAADSNSKFLIDFVEEYNINCPIFVLDADEKTSWILQFRLQNNVILDADMIEYVEPKIVYCKEDEVILSDIEYIKFSSPDSRFNIFLNPSYVEQIDLSRYCINVFDNIEMLDSEDTNFLYAGPYISLPRAEYEVVYQLQCSSEEDIIGYCEISANSGTEILKAVEINKEMFVNQEAQIRIPFSLYEDKSGIEFMIRVNDGVDLKLTDLYYYQKVNVYAPGLDDSEEFDKVIDDILDTNYSSKVTYMNSTLDEINLSYIVQDMKNYDLCVMSPEEIKEQSSTIQQYVIADAGYLDWMELLPEYTVISRHKNHVLLISTNAIKEDSVDLLSYGQAADLRLLENVQDGYNVAQLYTLNDGGEFKFELDLDEYANKHDLLCVEVLSGKSVIKKYNNIEPSSTIEFTLESYKKVNDLSFRIYSTNTRKEIKYLKGRVALLRNRINVTYDDQLKPLLDIVSTIPGLGNEIVLLSDNWKIEDREDISKYFGNINANFYKYIAQDKILDAQEEVFSSRDDTDIKVISYPESDWLITTLNTEMLYEFMAEYTVVARTDRYVLLIKSSSISQNQDIEVLSQESELSMDFFTLVDENGIKYQNINIPSGTYNLNLKVKKDYGVDLNDSELKILIRNGDTLYKEYNIQPDQDYIVVSSQNGFSDLQYDILSKGNSVNGITISGIEKVSDAFEIQLSQMQFYNGEYDEISDSIISSADTIYGPYCDLDPGDFEIIFVFKTDQPMEINFDIAVNGGEIIADSSKSEAKRS